MDTAERNIENIMEAKYVQKLNKHKTECKRDVQHRVQQMNKNEIM